MSKLAIDELCSGLARLDAITFESFVERLEMLYRESRDGRKCHIVCCGAGRMGYQVAAFSMRLSHLGFLAFNLSDTNVPRIGLGDIVLFNSSSGETPSMIVLAELAKKAGADILAVTANKDSTLGVMADQLLILPTVDSKQLMKTYYEQISGIVFDMLAERLVVKMHLDREMIERNHSILE